MNLKFRKIGKKEIAQRMNSKLIIKNENLFIDLLLGHIILFIMSYVVCDIFVRFPIDLVLSIIIAVLINWKWFRFHAYCIVLYSNGTLIIFRLFGNKNIRLHMDNIESVVFMEGGMSIGSPRLIFTIKNESKIEKYVLASRHRNQLNMSLDLLKAMGRPVFYQ